MTTPTYEEIATLTLQSNASSVSINNIPSTYGALTLTFTGKSTSLTRPFIIRPNSNSSNIYTIQKLEGDGSQVSAILLNPRQHMDFGSVGFTNEAHIIVDFFSYSDNNRRNVAIGKNTCLDDKVVLSGNGFGGTEVISSLLIIVNGDSIAAGSTISLWGLHE